MDRDSAQSHSARFLSSKSCLLSVVSSWRPQGGWSHQRGNGTWIQPSSESSSGPGGQAGLGAGMQETTGPGQRRELDVDWIRSRWLSPSGFLGDLWASPFPSLGQGASFCVT